MKERSNANLVSHLPSPPNVQPSYYESDYSSTAGLPTKMLESMEYEESCGTSTLSCQNIVVTTLALNYLATCRLDCNATIDIELHCFSPFTLAVSL